MKVALISDIHGNLPALEVVMNDINKRKADKIICLGDIIGKGPSSKAAVDICRSECDTVLIGNWKKMLYESCLALKQNRTDEITSRRLWYINDTGDERMEYLGALPHQTELHLSGKLVRLFHAHPAGFNRYFANSSVEQRRELFDYSEHSGIKKAADVAIYADIYAAYMQILDGKHLLNTGSVGNPLDINQASYVILEGAENSELESDFNVQFIRIPYDIEKAINMAREHGCPDLDGYISELRTAKYFNRS